MGLNDVDLNKLRVFACIAEEGGVSGAARRLALTRSAVSQSLAALEAALGVRLFDRVGRTMQLSREGRVLHERFTPHQRALRQLLAEICDADERATGPVRLGLFPGFSRVKLGDVLARFAGENPECEVRIVYAPQRDLDERLLSGTLDLVLSLEPRSERHERLHSQRLFQQVLVLAGPPEWISGVSDVRDLKRLPVVDYYRSDPLIDRWIEHHYPGLRPRLRFAAFAATTDLVLELLLRRAGIGVLPDHLAEPWQQSGQLAVLEPGASPLSEHIWLNERRGQYQGLALRRFREAISASFELTRPPLRG